MNKIVITCNTPSRINSVSNADIADIADKVDLPDKVGTENIGNVGASQRDSHLDNLYISGTRGKTAGDFRRSRAERLFPQKRWYGSAFQKFAFDCLQSTYQYTGVDCWGDPTVCSGDMSPRWSVQYQRVCMARIYSWAEVCRTAAGAALTDAGYTRLAMAHFVTLTVHHLRTGTYNSMVDTVENLRAAWASVRRRVNRAGWHYLRVMEPGERNGYPHFHMIVAGATDDQMEALITSWVAACNAHGNPAMVAGQKWERVDDIRNVGAYLTKYLSKSFQPSDGVGLKTWWRWMELAYRMRIRVYAMDKRSADYIAKKYPRNISGTPGAFEFVTPDTKETPEEVTDTPSATAPRSAAAVLHSAAVSIDERARAAVDEARRLLARQIEYSILYGDDYTDSGGAI